MTKAVSLILLSQTIMYQNAVIVAKSPKIIPGKFAADSG